MDTPVEELTEEKSDRRLTPLQHRFVEEYLIDPSSLTKAAIRAGYGINSAADIGSRLMKHPGVKSAIEAGQKARADRIGLTQDRVLQELLMIAFADPGSIIRKNDDGETTIDLGNMSKDQISALGELTVVRETGKKNSQVTKFTAIKPADRIAALEKIGKHLGMFKEKVEHTGVLTLEQLVTSSMEEDETDVG